MMRQAGSSLLAPMLGLDVLVAVGSSHRLEARPPFPRISIGVGPDVGFSEFVVGVKVAQVNFDKSARRGLRKALEAYVKFKGLPKRDIGPTVAPKRDIGPTVAPKRDIGPNVATEFIDAVHSWMR